MSDGKIDYHGYSNAELGEALQAIDRERYPRNYENLQAALLKRRQRDPVGKGRVLEADPRNAMAHYSVRFTTTNLVGVPENSLGMAGGGKLEISADHIFLTGKSAIHLWSDKRVLAFAKTDIVSVERLDQRFRIRFQPPASPPQYVTLTADYVDADAIAARLPAVSRVTALPATGEIAEFEGRLAAIGGRTPVTYSLIGINVAVFAAMASQGAGVFEPNGTVHIVWGSNLVPVTVGGEWWRLGTSMFLHFGVVHLLINMWVLHVSGRLTERMYGSTRFAILYLFAGLCGSMASAWWHPAANSAGASGAVFGVLGGLLAYMLVKRYRIPTPIIQAHRMSLIAFVAYNILVGLRNPAIDNAAHLGGLLGGALIGFALARPIDVEARTEQRTLRVAGIAVAAALVLVAAADFVQRSKQYLRPDERSAAAELWFTYGESKILGTYNNLVLQAQAGQVTDAEFAGRLAADVLPFYARAKEHLRYDPAIVEEEVDYGQALASYVRLRHESLALMESAARAGDPQGVARAMEVSVAADAAVERVNKAAGRAESARPR